MPKETIKKTAEPAAGNQAPNESPASGWTEGQAPQSGGTTTGPHGTTEGGLDTQDESAKQFVESGASAHDFVKPLDRAPSAEELRADDKADARLAVEDMEAAAAGQSNHNTLTPPNPVQVQQADRPDYNPQRRPSSRANQMSSVAESPQVMAERVDRKKDNPTNADITLDRRIRSNENREQPLASPKSPYLGEN
jgi:hypothetical protein